MPQVVCVGGACVDRKYQVLADVQTGTSNPARARRSFGGVARNVAENLARLGVSTALVSVVGNDEAGVALVEHAQRCGIDTHLIVRDPAHPTPEYAAVFSPDGNLVIGVADMHALEGVTVGDLQKYWSEIRDCEWLFVDCNMPSEVIAWCITQARSAGVRVAVDAVSEPKICRLAGDLSGIDLLILNELEAAVYLYENMKTFRRAAPPQHAQAVRAHGASCVVLTRGAEGLVAAGETIVELPAVPAECADVTGAGDALIAGIIAALLWGSTLEEAARTGSLCAALTVETTASVRADLSRGLLTAQRHRLEACTPI